MPWDPLDDLSAAQRERLSAYGEMLLHFNARLNLISREDEDRVAFHVRHGLTLAHRAFPPGSVVVDWGTGGGLPAVPLAVRFPDVRFHAVDAVRKKVQAVRAMARRLGLRNLEAHHVRAEQWTRPHHYSVSRATAPLATLWTWHRRAAVPLDGPVAPDVWPPGLLCLKGGALGDEIADARAAHPEAEVTQRSLHGLTDDDVFMDKYIVHVSAR